jgi:GMP synthase-like glutamine amidotransferase
MKIHWYQHVPFEGLGSIEPWARAQGYTLTCTRLYAGEKPPPASVHDWLIVMGGPMNIYEEREHPWLAGEKRAIRAAIDAGQRVLGICLGVQLIADVLGAKVVRNAHKEIGWFPVELTAEADRCAGLADFPPAFEAFHWHGDTFGLPPGAVHLARSEACAQQAFAWHDRVMGLQFHLETTAASAAELIDHARDEIVPAPFIQPAAAMLAEPARFARLNVLMDRLLHRMSGQASAAIMPPIPPASPRSSPWTG